MSKNIFTMLNTIKILFIKVINDLKGYFKYSKEKDRKELEFIMEDQKQAKIYNQIWDKIKELINSVDCVNFRFGDYFRDRDFFRFDTDDTLPLDGMVSVYSMTIVIRSVYRTYYDRFYPKIHLTNCIYKTCYNTTELIFLKILISKNVKKHLENVVYVNSIIFEIKTLVMDNIYIMVVMICIISIQNLSIINHNGNYYLVNFAFMSKKEAFNLIKNAVIIDKKGTL